MVVCPACNSTHLLSGNQLENVGKSAILTDFPSIFQIHQTYLHKDWRFTTVGRVRYDYGDGWWDEWFVRSDGGKESWVSVDEGDIATESLIQKNPKVPTFDELVIGSNVTINRIRMQVVEKNICTMVGAQGELPFKIIPNETYHYADLLGPKRLAFTIEYQNDRVECYKGVWIDPFEITQA
jgi:hypothetical protein